MAGTQQMIPKHLTSLQHPLVKHLVKLKNCTRYRNQTGTVLIEGSKLVEEVTALRAAKAVLATKDPGGGKRYAAETFYTISDAVLNKITGTVEPEGVVAEVPLPQEASLQGIARLLVLDRIQDPGNMGTLLRTALALGWEGAFLLDGCCDPYNDKALRAAKGATFKLPWRKGGWKELSLLGAENKMDFYAATLSGKELCDVFKAPDALLLVLGNEARGVSQEAMSACKGISIPMSGKMESLNVSAAGAILMYELRGKEND